MSKVLLLLKYKKVGHSYLKGLYHFKLKVCDVLRYVGSYINKLVANCIHNKLLIIYTNFQVTSAVSIFVVM